MGVITMYIVIVKIQKIDGPQMTYFGYFIITSNNSKAYLSDLYIVDVQLSNKIENWKIYFSSAHYINF